MKASSEPQRTLSVLRLLLTVEETSGPYNQFTLPMVRRHDITLCTFFRSRIEPAAGMRVYEGDGTLAGFFRRLKTALAEKDFHIVHVHSPHLGLFLVLASLFVGRDLLSKAVYTVHSSYPNFKWRNRLFLLPVFALFQRVVCCGEASLKSFPRFFRRLAAGRLSAVPNGVDLERIDRARAARPDARRSRRERFTIAAVGRLIDVKDPGVVFEAFRRLPLDRPPAKELIFLGDGILRDGLRQEVRKAGLEGRVQLPGLVDRERVYECLMNADLFVSAARVEGIPIAVLEAMANGCPVILSDIAPHREIAAGAEFIPLVPPGDAGRLAREIEKIAGMPPWERRRVGAACREIVERRFTLVAMQRQYQDLYEEIIDFSPARSVLPPAAEIVEDLHS